MPAALQLKAKKLTHLWRPCAQKPRSGLWSRSPLQAITGPHTESSCLCNTVNTHHYADTVHSCWQCTQCLVATYLLTQSHQIQ